MLKIALPISSFLPSLGGAEIGLHNICLNLKEKGHHPTVITSFSHKREILKKRIVLPYKVISYPPKIFSIFKKNSRLGFFLLNLFYSYIQKKYDFNFWHSTFGYPVGVSVISFCKSNNLPHLVRCVGEDIQIDNKIPYGMRINPKIDALIRKWLPKSNCLIAVSKNIKKEYLDIGASKKIIKLLPNGVNLKRISNFKSKSGFRQKIGINNNDFVFLSLGRYHVKKNFELLITTFEKILNKNIKLIIAGTGMKHLIEIVHNKKIKDNITILEISEQLDYKQINNIPSDKIFDLYKISDCFIMPSKIESFGIVTIEAMSFGLPIIASNNTGNIDILNNGEYGMLFDGSENSLAHVINKLMKNKNLIVEYANKSLWRSKKYDWSEIVESYILIYKKLIKKARYNP